MSAPGEAAERLKRDLGSLLDAGRSVASNYAQVGGSFRRLVLSDFSLARVALIRGLVFLVLCALMAGTGWLVAMVMLVLGMHQLGLNWMVALLLGLSSITVPWATLLLSVALYILVPVVLAALLRFLEAHEPDLVAVSEEIGVKPEALVAARHELEQ